MKRFWVLTGIVVLSLVSIVFLTGCVSKSEHEALQSEYEALQSEYEALQSKDATLQGQLSTIQQQLTVAQETLKGLGITIYSSRECSDVALIDNPEAANPTFEQLISFLLQDSTETHVFIPDVYDCSQYSRDLHNNAESAGIRAAEVQISFSNAFFNHALNAFLTSDYGLVYIDNARGFDTFARIKVGEAYRAVKLSWISGMNIRADDFWDGWSSYYYIAPFDWAPPGFDWETTVNSISIYW